MIRFRLLSRVLLASTILVIPASQNVAEAETPVDHAEWLDRLLADFSTPEPFTTVGVGNLHACALGADKQLACWGADDDAQATPPQGTYTALSVGQSHNCAVADDQSVHCWGWNLHGQATAPAGDFSSVSTADSHSCGIHPDQSAECWGLGDYGKTIVPQGSYVAVSTGAFHTCGLLTDQSINCWGDTSMGQSTVPAGSYQQVSAGINGTCALKTDHTVACWGLLVTSNVPAGTFASVATGWRSACAIATDQSIMCWGDDDIVDNVPVSGDFVSVSLGSYDACAIETNQRVTCWGEKTDAVVMDSPAEVQGQLSDQGVDDYVTDLEATKTNLTAQLAARTAERDAARRAPVCDLDFPAASAATAKAGANRILRGSARWNTPATKANIAITISRPGNGSTKYWISGNTWSNTPTANAVISGTTFAGLSEAPWSLIFPVESVVGRTYTVRCSATDTLSNTSPAVDIGKFTSVA